MLVPQQCRPYSTISYNTVFCSSYRNQGPRFKSTLYRTSSPGPGENVAKQNKLVLPSVGRRKMRAVGIKTFDIDQGHFLVYVRAETMRYEMGKCSLKPVEDAVTVSKVKYLAGKYLSLKPASLKMFGLFSGDLGRPTTLLQDMDPLPVDVDQFCFQRSNFVSSEEVEITSQDSRAMELVFWEVKNVFENGKIWPMMKQPQWKKLFDVSAECQKEWITKSVIPFHIMTKFIETLRATIPLFYWSCYYWCHCYLQSKLKGKERGTEVVVIPNIHELIIYDTTLGKKFVSWPWSKVASVNLKLDTRKLLVFKVFTREERVDIMRDIAVTSNQCQYIFTIVVHIINLLEEQRARYCHYPLGILWSKQRRVPEISGEYNVFHNTILCNPLSSPALLASDESWKEMPRDTQSPSLVAKEDKPLFFLKPISVQKVQILPSKQIPNNEKVIFRLSTPIDSIREIVILHYFGVKPIVLTVAVTPIGESKIVVHQIVREIGSLLGISDNQSLSIFGLFKDDNEELIDDSIMLPLSHVNSKTTFWFKRLSFSPSLEDSILDNNDAVLKSLFNETYHVISNAFNRPAISMKHFSALQSTISHGDRKDLKPTFHQMAEFMKYVHFYIPFYWQSYYGALSTIARGGDVVGSYDGLAVFLAMNIHKLEILGSTFEAKLIGGWLWVKVHSMERSKLDSQLLTFRGFYGKNQKLVEVSFHSPQRDYLFSIAAHVFKLLDQKYHLVSFAKKENISTETTDVIFNNVFFISDKKLKNDSKNTNE